ncbi:MAG: hypothetical protein ACD_64C00257G0002 [uncultured bacterium]|nr:MAG: hypothetical protein ACD_64C00257G0002 [uncultured bacterium]
MTDIFSTFSQSLSTLWMLTTWSDIVEISIISTCFYYTALWLKKDRNTNLLAYFYGFLFFLFAAHGLQLTTLTSILLLFSPSVVMLFMLMHQQLLQRNFVSLKNVTLATQSSCPDWLSAIMKKTLDMLAHNKNILILIEHTDALRPHLAVTEPLDVPITHGIITLLFNTLYDPEYLCWISSTGMLRGINVSFKASWHPHSYQTNNAWVDDAVAYTSQTDAVILYAHADSHQYAIAHQGIIHEGLSMEQAHKLIKKCINYQVPIAQKGYSHGVPKQESLSQRSA